MRCLYCSEPAGWWHRRCALCRRLHALFVAHRGVGMSAMMELFMATGAPPDAVERFLNADVDGRGAIRDHIAADMTNELLQALGQSRRQTSADVKRIRQRGGWLHLDKRPRE